ncbi:MAG: hypothetical protein H0U60_18605 [Blastocatellia bacterium]|nr:hypothetical protein [Blastocatellia bacterium]
MKDDTKQSLEREAEEIERKAAEYLEQHPDDFDDSYLSYHQWRVAHLRLIAANAPDENDEAQA